MSEWKCGKCGKEYSSEEYLELPMIRVKTVEEDPKDQYGRTHVCFNCGYIFHKDKFRERDTIIIKIDGKKEEIDVSTIFLELNHDGYYYETMIFPKGNINSYFQNRYKTEEEAKKGHEKIVEKIKKGDFKLNVSERELTLK